jgi:Trypsin-like serine proteases, typically periplasmic, contain C-terminal PDZ domain
MRLWADMSGFGSVFGGGLAGQTIGGRAWDLAVEPVKKATVLVRNEGCDFEATGSAVAVTSDELVTNAHVVEGARRLSILTTSGRRVEVRSWAVSKSDDLALLRLSETLFDHPVAVAADQTVPGNLVVVMGYPLGGPLTVGRGRVLEVTPDPSGSGQKTIQASVDILPGNSGGPLLDIQGRLVGVVRAIDLDNGSAQAIPSAQVSDLIAGKSTRPGQPC